MRATAICDECTSEFFLDASSMIALCPECAHWLCGCDNCEHDGLPCRRCGWDGSRSRYVQSLAGIESPALASSADALALLARLGASPWLIRHHELVVEAATELYDGLERELGDFVFGCEDLLLGAALHDVGKIVVPEEMSEPGHRHEQAGRTLLIAHDVPSDVTCFCVSHAQWMVWRDVSLTDLLVALADKLWKGKRDEALQKRVLDELARDRPDSRWEIFAKLDAVCEAVADAGPSRLARSNV